MTDLDKEFAALLGGNVGNSGGSRSIFKPKDHIGSYVMLIEPKKYNPEARNPFAITDPTHKDYDERRLTRRELTARITVFQSPEALDAGQGLELTDALITQPFLAEDLGQSVGKVEIAKLATRSNGPGKQPSYVWRAAEGDVIGKVAAYYKAREKALDEALASDDVPDYLKA